MKSTSSVHPWTRATNLHRTEAVRVQGVIRRRLPKPPTLPTVIRKSPSITIRHRPKRKRNNVFSANTSASGRKLPYRRTITIRIITPHRSREIMGRPALDQPSLSPQGDCKKVCRRTDVAQHESMLTGKQPQAIHQPIDLEHLIPEHPNRDKPSSLLNLAISERRQHKE